jgi:hypothetical protein
MGKDIDRNYRNLQSFELSLQHWKKIKGKWTPGVDSKLGCLIVINLNLKVIRLKEIGEYKEEIGDGLKRVIK